jgi:hypothetical protein
MPCRLRFQTITVVSVTCLFSMYHSAHPIYLLVLFNRHQNQRRPRRRASVLAGQDVDADSTSTVYSACCGSRSSQGRSQGAQPSESGRADSVGV